MEDRKNNYRIRIIRLLAIIASVGLISGESIQLTPWVYAGSYDVVSDSDETKVNDSTATIAAPTFDPISGSYSFPGALVSLSSETENVLFRSTSGSLYPNHTTGTQGAKIMIPSVAAGTYTINSVAYKDADNISPISSVTYNIVTDSTKYIIKEGSGQEFEIVLGQTQTISFTGSGQASDFKTLYIDGKLVLPSNYTLSGPDTFIVINPTFLETLVSGTHSIAMVYIDGYTTGLFTITGRSATGTSASTSISPVGAWKSDNKGWWYQRTDKTYPRDQWEQIDGKWYHFDKSGYMQTGWLEMGRKWYYLKSSGAMATGWTKVGNRWYYMSDNGAMATGWVKSGDDWYYMNASGEMQTGWMKEGGKWYYLNSGGDMASGWIKSGNKWYYMKSSGAMSTGWQKVGGKWYYLNAGGDMVTGWKKDKGKWYYLESSGAMLSNTSRKIGNKIYNFNSVGVCTNP